MFFLTSSIYVEQDYWFDSSTTREYGFVDSRFNKVMFASDNIRRPLFNVTSFDVLDSDELHDTKFILYTNTQTYWNIVRSAITHVVTNIFKIDGVHIKELFDAYRIKWFAETGDNSPIFEDCVNVNIPLWMLPVNFSDCAFELLVYYSKITKTMPNDVDLGKKVSAIMNKWLEDRSKSAVMGLLKHYDLFNKPQDELFEIASFVLANQPITNKQRLALLDKYYHCCGVITYPDPDHEREIRFLLEFLKGEVSIVDCFDFLKDNKVKAFSYEREKINEWVLYKCFVIK